MPATLKDFLVGLAADSEKLSSFVADPEAAIASADLPEGDADALRRGDAARLYASLVPERSPTPRVRPATRAAPATHDERLVAVGMGIRTVGQLTMEAAAWIERVDKVLYVLPDPVAEALVHELNPEGAESLAVLYRENEPRIDSYHAMVEKTLSHVRRGERVCLATYGHPGVFAYPTHESIRRARAEGYPARMLPGVSAEDCLFADLGIDPGTSGCQSYEATDFLINQRWFDPSSHVVLWQIGVLGDVTYQPHGSKIRGMEPLLQRLMSVYGPYHPVYVYEAAMLPGVEATVRQSPLWALPRAGISPLSTLYVPPGSPPRTDLMLTQSLGLSLV